MDKNLEDMENICEEMDLSFLDDDLLNLDDEEISEILKELLEDNDDQEDNS